jgi:hypothetical protein
MDRNARSAAPRNLVARARAVVARIRQAASVVAADTRLALARPVRDKILVVASVAFIVWVFKLLNDELRYADLGFDEQHFVWGGWCILKGLVPYRDFSEYKPPMVFVTHAIALAIHGFRDLKFRWFFFYWPLASLIALYAAMLSRKIDKICALAAVLAIVHLFVGHQFHDTALTDTESIGLTYYFFGVACLVARPARYAGALKAVGFGLLTCCAFSKEPYMAAVFFTWLAGFFLDGQPARFREDAVRYMKWTAIGVGAVVAGLCLYLVPSGGMGFYLRMVRSYARIYKDPQHSYCVMFGRFTPTSALNDFQAQWRLVGQDFFNFKVIGCLAPFAVLFFLFVPRRSMPLAVTTLLALLGGLWATTASKCAWGHYYVMAMSGLFFAVVVALDGLARSVPSARVNRLVGWVLLAGVFALIWPRVDKEMESHEQRAMPNAYAEAVPGSLAYVANHTKPGDKIFTTSAPGLYVQADRVGAVRESTFLDEVLYGYPGNTDEERLSGVRAELEKNMPKVVILDPFYDSHRPKHLSLLIMPFLKSHGYRQDSPYFWARPY